MPTPNDPPTPAPLDVREAVAQIAHAVLRLASCQGWDATAGEMAGIAAALRLSTARSRESLTSENHSAIEDGASDLDKDAAIVYNLLNARHYGKHSVERQAFERILAECTHAQREGAALREDYDDACKNIKILEQNVQEERRRHNALRTAVVPLVERAKENRAYISSPNFFGPSWHAENDAILRDLRSLVLDAPAASEGPQDRLDLGGDA